MDNHELVSLSGVLLLYVHYQLVRPHLLEPLFMLDAPLFSDEQIYFANVGTELQQLVNENYA